MADNAKTKRGLLLLLLPCEENIRRAESTDRPTDQTATLTDTHSHDVRDLSLPLPPFLPSSLPPPSWPQLTYSLPPSLTHFIPRSLFLPAAMLLLRQRRPRYLSEEGGEERNGANLRFVAPIIFFGLHSLLRICQIALCSGGRTGNAAGNT